MNPFLSLDSVKDIDAQFKVSSVLGVDSYKFAHWAMTPKKMTRAKSYLESRGGMPTVITYGALNYHTLKLFGTPITKADIDDGEDFCARHFGRKDVFNRKDWELILSRHGGYLPVEFRSAPEGLKVPNHNALLMIENTDDDLPWVSNYVETRASHVWYPYTVASVSHACRKIILKWLYQTGTPEEIDFKLHNFGYRASTCELQAAIGDSAHLANFKGTDTVPGILFLQRFYRAGMAGFSIPASEHFTVTSWLKSGEVDAYRAGIQAFPDGLLAMVSDSYDIYHAVEHIYGEVLRDEILKRNGVLVIRPDSGYPPDVCLKVIELLGQKFGYTVNSKGYKVLNPKVRVIQGDGITMPMIDLILYVLAANGWSADNIAFGMGSGLMQMLNRDTLKIAFKCSYAVVDGEPRNVCKSPITDPGKNSKFGDLRLFSDGKDYITADKNTALHSSFYDITELRYHKRPGGDPQFYQPPTTWDTICQRALVV